MTLLKRRTRRSLAVLAGFVVALMMIATSAVAGDGVPRPPGAVDNRGYELVSQADKNQSHAAYGFASTDGNRFLYSIVGGVPGTTSGARPMLLATRGDGGWTSKNLLPPTAQQVGQHYLEAAATPDLSEIVASAFDGLGSEAFSSNISIVRLDNDAQQTLLQTFPVYFGGNGVEILTSDDLSSVIANVPLPIDASHQPDTHNIYDFGTGVPDLVSRMPGTNLAPTCGVFPGSTIFGFANATGRSSVADHWVSEDGSRVFFGTVGDDAPGCAAPLHLYLRDRDTGTTTLIDGPPLAGDTDFGLNRFLRASPTGDWVIYRTATSLAAADDVDANKTDQDIYRWDEGVGNTCLTCVVPSARVEIGDDKAAVSADGTHVYFASRFQLADAPAAGTAGAPNLYVVRSGAVNHITRTQINAATSISGSGGDVTPNGNVLIFRSNRAELNAISGSINGGHQQFYRYDDVADTVTCVSCPPPGGATTDVPNFLAVTNQAVPANVQAVSDDGSIVVFMTSDKLVPQDHNGDYDLYEWHDGDVKLITDGLTEYPENTFPSLLGVSGDGRDVFFVDLGILTSDAQDGAYKLYDARVNGGFPPAPASPPGCDGDACHGLPSTQPALTDLPSSLIAGDGNVVAAPPGRFSLVRPTPAQRARFARTGRLTLSVNVSEGGRVSVLGTAKLGHRVKTVARGANVTRKAGVVQVQLRLSQAARSRLSEGGVVKLVLVTRFSRSLVSKRVSLKLEPPAAAARVHATADGR